MEQETIKEKLKNEVNGWAESITVRRIVYEQTQSNVKQLELELKKAKYVFGQARKNWVEARKMHKRAKSRLSSLDWRKRNYAKQHFGEVINKLMN